MGSPYDPVAWRRTLRNLKVGAPKEDPGPSAVDRGQGMTEAEVADTVKRIRAWPLDPIPVEPDKPTPLPPEVLAQLQRIEDMLTKILEEGKG